MHNRILKGIDMKTLNLIALALTIVGGVNWGLYGLFGLDLVAMAFGAFTVAAKIVYVLVATSALYCIMLFKPVVNCGPGHLTTP